MEYIAAKTIVTRNKSTAWFGTEYNMNIYKGRCHGCIYCDSRSDCYHVDNFDTVRAKENALMIIRDDLRRKVKTGVVGTGAMSDPYNPFEKKLQLTRHALELIDAYEFGAAIATKSALITRDIDILKSIKEHSPVLCKITITCADDKLAGMLEPNVSSSSERFEAIAELNQNGIYAGILMMPILPFINDTKENIMGIVRNAKEAGARFIYPALGMTLRQNQREWYLDHLEKLFPGRNLKKLYDSRYGSSYECRVPDLKNLWRAFSEECNRLGILYDMKDIVRSYRLGYGDGQLSFFD